MQCNSDVFDITPSVQSHRHKTQYKKKSVRHVQVHIFTLTVPLCLLGIFAYKIIYKIIQVAQCEEHHSIEALCTEHINVHNVNLKQITKEIFRHI